MSKTALITGVTGQDGALLAQLLLAKGYRVHGSVRSRTELNLERLCALGIERDVILVDVDLSDSDGIRRVIEQTQADEIYNLAAQSRVGLSFDQPVRTCDVGGMNVVRLLEALRILGKGVRFYQASSSEMFGLARETPQTETTPFYPRSPYGAAKAFAHWMTVTYRESYGLFGVSGILFNHESPWRGREFVTRKITSGLAEIRHGRRDILRLGNLAAQRDWGFAGDYVDGMWRMLQQPEPEDFILATGTATTVRHFVEIAAGRLGFELTWSGTGADEIGIDRRTGRRVVEVDPGLYRPAEADSVLGNAAKAKAKLGWVAQTSLDELIAMMTEADERRVIENRMSL